MRAIREASTQWNYSIIHDKNTDEFWIEDCKNNPRRLNSDEEVINVFTSYEELVNNTSPGLLRKLKENIRGTEAAIQEFLDYVNLLNYDITTDVYDDYIDDVRCTCVRCNGLNAMLTGNLTQNTYKLMERYPDVAIESVVDADAINMYDRIFCFALAKEYYKESVPEVGGSITEGKDYLYKAKVNGKWLKGNTLVKNKRSADTFESDEEPTQRINQMKKDGKLDKDAKIEILKESITDFDIQNRPMYSFAKGKHDATGAVRKHSGNPYWEHPEGVAKLAVAYGGTDEEIQVAMAHDTLEDTHCTFDELAELFGDEVANLVSEITNDRTEIDRIGKEQYINRELVSLSHPALFVKLLDMLYNMWDYPRPSQKDRMNKNILHLLQNRADDLTDRELDIIDDLTA